MNREYKFKVWLKKEKKMVEPLSINLEKQQILFNEPSDKYWTEVRIVSFDDVEMLQYTGINDKNGVKIYEGDIVIYKFQNDDLKTKKLTVFFDEEDCSFSLAHKGKPYISMEKDDIKYYKVIGNIYENKELLENE